MALLATEYKPKARQSFIQVEANGSRTSIETSKQRFDLSVDTNISLQDDALFDCVEAYRSIHQIQRGLLYEH